MDLNSLEQKFSKMMTCDQPVTLPRAANGIEAVLSYLGSQPGCGKTIALPSFLCQSPLASVISAGWKPVFCDVEPSTAMPSFGEWERAAGKGVDAFLVVHLFGNTTRIKDLRHLCDERGIFLLEDACQSLGVMSQGAMSGTWGHAGIFSFGATKTIDVGMGGMLLADAKVSQFTRNWLEQRPVLSRDKLDQRAQLAKRFSQEFYRAKSLLTADETEALSQLRGLLALYMPLLHEVWNSQMTEKIAHQLDRLDEINQLRCEKFARYKSNLRDLPIQILSSLDTPVPWRFNFRISGMKWAEQNSLSESVRNKNVHISNWYLPSHWLSDQSHDSVTPDLPGTTRLSQEIFQLWLDDTTSMENVDRNSLVLRECLEKMSHST